jgi:hypothetical protein
MFDWQYFDTAGKELGSSERFEDQATAEAWVGGSWEQLVADGVFEMALRDLDGGTEIYKMGLSPE